MEAYIHFLKLFKMLFSFSLLKEELYQNIVKELEQEGKCENKQITSKDVRFHIKPVEANPAESSNSTSSEKLNKTDGS